MLPTPKTMYQAFLDKDSSFEGIFWVGVRTTKIFCRPTCTAKKAKEINVEYFSRIELAQAAGYRPCKVCRPLALEQNFPDWIASLLDEVKSSPALKLSDTGLRARGISPVRIRRWFLKHHNMTFHAYVRSLKMVRAAELIKSHQNVIDTSYTSGYESLSGFNHTFKKTTGLSPKAAKEKNLIIGTKLNTPLGPMLAAATNKGVCLLDFADETTINMQVDRVCKVLGTKIVFGTNTLLEKLNSQVKEYFSGQRKHFTVPIAYTGTDFQNTVWQALYKVSYAQTRSYQQLANSIAKPKAVRAVAKANADNRILLILPCHRIIGSDQSLTGYRGGIWRKEYLLNLEATY